MAKIFDILNMIIKQKPIIMHMIDFSTKTETENEKLINRSINNKVGKNLNPHAVKQNIIADKDTLITDGTQIPLLYI